LGAAQLHEAIPQRSERAQMIERILSKDFRKTLLATFTDVYAHHKREEVESFKQDEERIKKALLAKVEPHPLDQPLDEDYLVAAVDGSGSAEFATINDVRVHLLTSATVVLNTGTHDGNLFHEVDHALLKSVYNAEQPLIDFHWHTGVREDARAKIAETAEHFYPVETIEEIVLPFFRDILKESSLKSLDDLRDTSYAPYVDDLSDMKTLISRAQAMTNAAIHDELRKIFEYSAARRLIDSDLAPKYLLLDGALSVFLHAGRKYPSLPSGFMLRELLEAARKKGVIVCAVSKNHTVPFAYQIADIARKKFETPAKWFCLLPSDEDPDGGLHIYEKRTYIPPILAVPYLFSFSQDNRPSRIDFDRIWWLENIFVPDDPDKTRENELALFRDLDLMSRDARWYGYPVALGLAHERCVLRRDDLRIAREIGRVVQREAHLDFGDIGPLREDYNL